MIELEDLAMCEWPIRSALIALLVVILAPNLAHANDSTISCDAPPDKAARVAVHPGTQVSSTQDNQAKTCTFSINGAVATSPPPQQVIDALNVFRSSGSYSNFDVAISALAALMAAGAPVDEVPRELLQLLMQFKSALSRCLWAYVPGNFSTEAYSEGPISCRGLAPYSNERQKREMLESTGAAVGVPTIVISAVWGGGRFKSAVYLPTMMVVLPPLR